MLQFTAFFITVCAVCVCARRRFEQALAPAVCALMLLLTLLAMPRRLFRMDGVAVAALLGVAALAAYALLARRLTPRELGRRLAAYALTPGLLCFGAAVALYAYACQPMVVWWRDDVAHWALMPKSLWAYNGFLDGAHHLNPTFGGYLPGMQVLQWWVLHALGEWSEPALYATLFSCYAAFLLPLVGRMRWKRVWLAPLATAALLALPAWANSTCYAVLSVDTALAACFGYTLVRIYELNRRDGPGLLAVALGLCGLVLIKQIGVVFAVIAMVMMAVLGRCRAQGRARVALCWLAPLVTLGAWLGFCRAQGLGGMHTTNLMDTLGQMLRGAYVPPAGGDGVADAIGHAFLNAYTGEMNDMTSAPVRIPLLVWCVLPVALLLLPFGNGREKRRAAIVMALAAAGYVLMQYASFFTVFYWETEVYTQAHRDKMILLMERYMTPIVLGFAMLAARILAGEAARRTGPWPAACLAALAVTAALGTNWSAMAESLIPKRYIQHDRALGAEASVRMDHDWAESLAEIPDACALVGLEVSSDFIKDLRYAFAPTRFELPTPQLEDAQALRAFLREKRVTHVICFDDVHLLFAPMRELAEDGEAYPWTVYEVAWDEEGSPSLAAFY